MTKIPCAFPPRTRISASLFLTGQRVAKAEESGGGETGGPGGYKHNMYSSALFYSKILLKIKTAARIFAAAAVSCLQLLSIHISI